MCQTVSLYAIPTVYFFELLLVCKIDLLESFAIAIAHGVVMDRLEDHSDSRFTSYFPHKVWALGLLWGMGMERL